MSDPSVAPSDQSSNASQANQKRPTTDFSKGISAEQCSPCMPLRYTRGNVMVKWSDSWFFWKFVIKVVDIHTSKNFLNGDVCIIT